MSKKFIPNGDLDFVTMAEAFARAIAKEPARFEIAPEDSEELSATVRKFRAALQACYKSGRSQVATRSKEDARLAAEQIVRRLGNLIRNNVRIDAATKVTVRIHPRAQKARIQPCPQEPPRVKFVRADHQGNGATPMHELSFAALDYSKGKPEG